MGAEENLTQMPDPNGSADVEGAEQGPHPWRLYVSGLLLLAAGALWVAVALEEKRFARRMMGPDSDLLSPAELEDQLHV